MADLYKQGAKNSRGKIIVRADSVKESNWEVLLKIGASNLPNQRFCFCFTNNNPYFEIYRAS
jgi:hypothetical protein